MADNTRIRVSKDNEQRTMLRVARRESVGARGCIVRKVRFMHGPTGENGIVQIRGAAEVCRLEVRVVFHMLLKDYEKT